MLYQTELPWLGQRKGEIQIKTSGIKVIKGTDLPNYKLFIVISKCLTKVTVFQ